MSTPEYSVSEIVIKGEKLSLVSKPQIHQDSEKRRIFLQLTPVQCILGEELNTNNKDVN